ncbi:anaerobic ribonucleoside-triphosphate reductase activating protein [Cuneatibacter sp. NSJ-177]|jgi:pyruvate formate lyase activating enzyme|uniref:anaerobic ribonucleoside-triphosphate reductase activating protein n=1 Tax=Cuneatibacter sp. NSJ-177 TaxID=2931401 RepID=UPI001FD53089|nr:anaerobic ribonucleoside-triphosphate reductase activating protein [Cuneatibacter sp. NSJ-177]MCJ7836664.1 anaerobic ribonucleoside-triphosphate reductase activating protein [Cuneatibacter sp. NSJ-177]
MKIGGFQKLTLLDYPGKLSATVFTGGCNFCCPFCHNSELILPGDTLPEEEILSTLKKRRRMLEGVCITGGEPTLQKDLETFIEKLKEMDYLVKLDTNGYKPDILRRLCERGIVDYVAMDLKGPKSKYAAIAGREELSLDRIEESAAYLLKGTVDYEFRTTVVPELHEEADFPEIGEWIRGAKAYYLQAYKDSEYVLDRRFTSPSEDFMETLRKLVLPFVPNTALRGIG